MPRGVISRLPNSVFTVSDPYLCHDTHHFIECCSFCDSIFSQYRDIKNPKFAKKKYLTFGLLTVFNSLVDVVNDLGTFQALQHRVVLDIRLPLLAERFVSVRFD